MKIIETKNIFAEICNDWIQFKDRKQWNWIELNLLKLYYEDDRMHGNGEFEVYLLGFGIRITWVNNKKQNKKKAKEYNHIIRDIKKRSIECHLSFDTSASCWS